MYLIGRAIQIIGMIIVPQGVVLELMGRVSLWQSLFIALGGIGVFLIGNSIQRSARSGG